MTVDEFIEILAETERAWKFRIGDETIIQVLSDVQEGRSFIIRDPLTAVAAKVTGNFFAINHLSQYSWGAAGKALSLEEGDITRIFEATYRMPGYDENLRLRLEKATGLS